MVARSLIVLIWDLDTWEDIATICLFLCNLLSKGAEYNLAGIRMHLYLALRENIISLKGKNIRGCVMDL